MEPGTMTKEEASKVERQALGAHIKFAQREIKRRKDELVPLEADLRLMVEAHKTLTQPTDEGPDIGPQE
jgi:hypothetical protein